MTTLGHSLTGLAALAYVIPSHCSWLARLVWATLFIALASIPDWPLPGWGHQDLSISHSLWLNMALCAAVAAILKKSAPERFGEAPLLAAGAFAWLSHILLDTLYGDLPGTAIFWPFSDAAVTLPVPWLQSLPHLPPPFDATVIRILMLELLTFAPLVLLGYWLRKRWGVAPRA
ncbi:MAG: metal-dependent hydrolase [Desulfobacteraceae bacterium]